MVVSEVKLSRVEQRPPAWAGLVVVVITDGNRNYGLYRVKQIDEGTMVIVHGAISFPVGMHLDIEDFKYQAPTATSFRQRATVVDNSHDGIRLVW
jgi:hypothetical protein